MIAAYICHDYEGKLAIDNKEVTELRFFHINELPAKISPLDAPIIKQYIDYHS